MIALRVDSRPVERRNTELEMGLVYWEPEPAGYVSRGSGIVDERLVPVMLDPEETNPHFVGRCCVWPKHIAHGKVLTYPKLFLIEHPRMSLYTDEEAAARESLAESMMSCFDYDRWEKDPFTYYAERRGELGWGRGKQ